MSGSDVKKGRADASEPSPSEHDPRRIEALSLSGQHHTDGRSGPIDSPRLSRGSEALSWVAAWRTPLNPRGSLITMAYSPMTNIGPGHIPASTRRAVQQRFIAYLETKYPGTRWRPSSGDQGASLQTVRFVRRARLVAGTADEKRDDDR